MIQGAFSIIIDDQNRVLLCKRNDRDLWNLPGDTVEPGESPWSAAIREAQEEVGVTIAIDSLIGIYHKPAKNDLVFQFVARIVEGVPSLSEEAQEVKYFRPDEIPQNTAPLQKIRIERYFADPTVMRMEEQ